MPLKRVSYQRKTKTAILLVGEGPTERAFLRYIQEVYISRDSGVAVKVECGFGGSPKCVIERAMRLRANREYDGCFVVLDEDRLAEVDDKLRKRMKTRPPIVILPVQPCIEGLFLAILNHNNFSQTNAKSDFCKREFERFYLSGDRKTDYHAYSQYFQKAVLDSQRRNVAQLDAILKAINIV